MFLLYCCLCGVINDDDDRDFISRPPSPLDVACRRGKSTGYKSEYVVIFNPEID